MSSPGAARYTLEVPVLTMLTDRIDARMMRSVRSMTSTRCASARR
ncbi:hypothetical protein [Bradyrhizobium sp.]|nr:hypothetical protein [Bradyrhizobium sp.]HZR71469.1 hypothetical protein [Bradyrhizobium sp.]